MSKATLSVCGALLVWLGSACSQGDARQAGKAAVPVPSPSPSPSVSAPQRGEPEIPQVVRGGGRPEVKLPQVLVDQIAATYPDHHVPSGVDLENKYWTAHPDGTMLPHAVWGDFDGNSALDGRSS